MAPPKKKTVEEIKAMDVAHLKVYMGKHGIKPRTGKKCDLVARILAAQYKKSAKETVKPAKGKKPSAVVGKASATKCDLEAMRKPDLIKLARSIEVKPLKGTKADLVARIIAAGKTGTKETVKPAKAKKASAKKPAAPVPAPVKKAKVKKAKEEEEKAKKAEVKAKKAKATAKAEEEKAKKAKAKAKKAKAETVKPTAASAKKPAASATTKKAKKPAAGKAKKPGLACGDTSNKCAPTEFCDADTGRCYKPTKKGRLNKRSEDALKSKYTDYVFDSDNRLVGPSAEVQKHLKFWGISVKKPAKVPKATVPAKPKAKKPAKVPVPVTPAAPKRSKFMRALAKGCVEDNPCEDSEICVTNEDGSTKCVDRKSIKPEYKLILESGRLITGSYATLKQIKQDMGGKITRLRSMKPKHVEPEDDEEILSLPKPKRKTVAPAPEPEPETVSEEEEFLSLPKQKRKTAVVESAEEEEFLSLPKPKSKPAPEPVFSEDEDEDDEEFLSLPKKKLSEKAEAPSESESEPEAPSESEPETESEPEPDLKSMLKSMKKKPMQVQPPGKPSSMAPSMTVKKGQRDIEMTFAQCLRKETA